MTVSASGRADLPLRDLPLHVVVASRNAGKAAELRRLLRAVSWRLLEIDQAPGGHEIEWVEDGTTYLENATIKARAASAAAARRAPGWMQAGWMKTRRMKPRWLKPQWMKMLWMKTRWTQAPWMNRVGWMKPDEPMKIA